MVEMMGIARRRVTRTMRCQWWFLQPGTVLRGLSLVRCSSQRRLSVLYRSRLDEGLIES